MTLGQILYHVLRATHDEYGDLPLDGGDKDDVLSYLAAGGNTDAGTYFRVGRLPFRSFLQVNVDQQWSDTQDDLWQAIQIKTQTGPSLANPPLWGVDETLADVAQYVAFHV